MKGRWVVFMIFGILGMSAVANAMLIRFAVADPTFAIEPNYYDEALAWDARVAQREANARLGWKLTPHLQKRADGDAELVLDAVDADGAPLDGLAVSVNASPNLCARQRVRTELVSGRGSVGPACPGLWQLAVDARRGDDHFTELLVTELGAR